MKQTTELLTEWTAEQVHSAARSFLAELMSGTKTDKTGELISPAASESPAEKRRNTALSEGQETSAAKQLLTLMERETGKAQAERTVEELDASSPVEFLEETEETPRKEIREPMAERLQQVSQSRRLQLQGGGEPGAYPQMRQISDWFQRDSRRYDAEFRRY